ncbi:hypothetical protein PAPYR_3250 [Paratrimastix pyriformis]|uniref:Uncharacterized protein n=1 Tax=Paratrimastix pyriformis TaxID=342808 RepID=A0ABQ8USA5_9EUKA|nr:hypothetical protein PAPYR_3250 [Paratrimastix pyriformis]
MDSPRLQRPTGRYALRIASLLPPPSTQKEDISRKCCLCKESMATVICFECGEWILCDECSHYIHANELNRWHTVDPFMASRMPPPGTPSAPPSAVATPVTALSVLLASRVNLIHPRLCPRHVGVPHHQYCLDCMALACPHCLAPGGVHEGHRCVSFEAALPLVQQRLARRLPEMRQWRGRLGEALGEATRAREAVEGHRRAIVEPLRARFGQLRALLDRQESRMVAEVEADQAELRAGLEAHLAALQEHIGLLQKGDAAFVEVLARALPTPPDMAALGAAAPQQPPPPAGQAPGSPEAAEAAPGSSSGMAESDGNPPAPPRGGDANDNGDEASAEGGPECGQEPEPECGQELGPEGRLALGLEEARRLVEVPAPLLRPYPKVLPTEAAARAIEELVLDYPVDVGASEAVLEQRGVRPHQPTVVTLVARTAAGRPPSPPLMECPFEGGRFRVTLTATAVGEYRLHARRHGAEVPPLCPLRVLISDLPLIPAAPVCTQLGAYSLTLRWAPPHDNGVPVLGYRLLMCSGPNPNPAEPPTPCAGAGAGAGAGSTMPPGSPRGGGPCPATPARWREIFRGKALTRTLTNLRPARQYRFAVGAYSAVGDGGASADLLLSTLGPSSIARPAGRQEAASCSPCAAAAVWADVPLTPEPPLAADATPTAILIRWRAPPPNGVPVLGYRLMWVPPPGFVFAAPPPTLLPPEDPATAGAAQSQSAAPPSRAARRPASPLTRPPRAASGFRRGRGPHHGQAPAPGPLMGDSLLATGLEGYRELYRGPESQFTLGGLEPATRCRVKALFCAWLPPLAERWGLLYRGSRDGFTAEAFHSRCDGAHPTVTLIRSAAGAVFGGYTTVPWSAPPRAEGHADPAAFLFSIRRPRAPIRDPAAAATAPGSPRPTEGDTSTLMAGLPSLDELSIGLPGSPPPGSPPSWPSPAPGPATTPGGPPAGPAMLLPGGLGGGGPGSVTSTASLQQVRALSPAPPSSRASGAPGERPEGGPGGPDLDLVPAVDRIAPAREGDEPPDTGAPMRLMQNPALAGHAPAVVHYQGWGPSFGGHDLTVADRCEGRPSTADPGFVYCAPPGTIYRSPAARRFLAGSRLHFRTSEIEVYGPLPPMAGPGSPAAPGGR